MEPIMQDAAWRGKIYLDGWADAAGGTMNVVEPATGRVLGIAGRGNAEDIDRAVRGASQAQAAWAALPFDRRAAILRAAAESLQANAECLHLWNIRECGSIRPKSEWEVHAAYEQMHMAAAMTQEATGSIFPSALPGRLNLWEHVPLGVVGVIAPWNFPLLLALRSVAPALAVGNAVVLKPAPQSAVCGGLLIAEIFEAAGLPAGVLQVVPGGADAGDALVRHPLTAMVSFTGSTAVGRRIGEFCGASLKKTALELGGNNAFIVLEDADIEIAASHGAWGAFLHQGQICMQAGRHLVARKVADRYTAALAARAAQLVVGDPYTGQVHLGPLISQAQRDRVQEIVAASVAAGAEVVTGGTSDGLFYRPTVLQGVRAGMKAYTDEIFGPVAPVTVFDDLEQLVALANNTPYGLSAAIHTRTPMAALQIARRLRAGMVHINDQTVNNEFQVPFGGMGASGNGGRFGGPVNRDEFTQSQWISVQEKPLPYPF